MTHELAYYEGLLHDLAGQLASVGFMTRGSVVARHTRCGKADCACHGDPPALHGPYWQFSRAVAGKTVTKWVSEDQAGLYKEWIANRRRALAIMAEIEEVSRQAEEAITASRDHLQQVG
ncbi:MAG: hypothetical protein NVSMB32_00400 [Actinomycetota bacterium]